MRLQWDGGTFFAFAGRSILIELLVLHCTSIPDPLPRN